MNAAITAKAIEKGPSPFGNRPNPAHEVAESVFQDSFLDSKKDRSAYDRILVRASKTVTGAASGLSAEPLD